MRIISDTIKIYKICKDRFVINLIWHNWEQDNYDISTCLMQCKKYFFLECKFWVEGRFYGKEEILLAAGDLVLHIVLWGFWYREGQLFEAKLKVTCFANKAISKQMFRKLRKFNQFYS